MKEWIETLEAGVRLLIKVIGALILLMLLFWREPLAATFRDLTLAVLTTLDDAGIRLRKANLGGLEFEIDDTRQMVAGVGRALGEAVNVLDAAAPKATDPALRETLDGLSKQLRAAASGTERIDAQIGGAVTRALAVTPAAPGVAPPPATEPVPPAPVPAPPAAADGALAAALPAGGWGIVVGGDVDLASAQDEVARARKAVAQAALPALDVRVLQRGAWFRTVVIFAREADARGALPALQKRVRDSAYPVALERWCLAPVAREGHLLCST
ncbi:hypothetical protein EV699_10883 [Plasticicumulans lactativorans]|uniref:Uncharacterized protein n=1 Tax=Plasticicumulans lactativorans TaxID=1133106 RepID=A0A4R2L6D7_9GAMM|nr:hypothetical protein [Plasticicumulans lactativorans]TCO81452.1 hypothetical protein EV699_10883 [Plasticicumulans lactativorans]